MQNEKREILPGHYYRHFKGGLYYVLGIATDTETEQKVVVYRAQYGNRELFVRPYDMFAGIIDRQKYPGAAQKYRFEFVK